MWVSFALQISEGYPKFNAPILIVSAAISRIVCAAGCILISQMETDLVLQLVCSLIATLSVAAVRFVGKLKLHL